jgi:hypothetical protein
VTALGVILLTVLSYIDFAPKSSDAGLFVIPVCQEIPAARAEIAGVRIDGEPVTFLRDGLVEDLHRTLVEGQALVRRDGKGFDCTAFALLMSGVSLARVGKRRFRVTPSLEEVPIVDDIHQDYPLAVGDWPRFCKVPIYFHTLVPAHTPDVPLYLHKLGDEGPVCISGVNKAMKVVGGSRLARISSMRVSVGNQAVAWWEHGGVDT